MVVVGYGRGGVECQGVGWQGSGGIMLQKMVSRALCFFFLYCSISAYRVWRALSTKMAEALATDPEWKSVHTSKPQWTHEAVLEMAKFVIADLPEACNRKPSTNGA